MKTDKKTVGFGGGITNARTVRPKRCAAPVVQMRRCKNARMAAKKDARPKRQLRTGASNCRPQLTGDILTHETRWKKVCAGFLMVGMFSGILPLALAEIMFYAAQAAMAALESLIGSAGMTALGIGLCLVAIVAGMAYLHRLVFR